MTEWTEAELDEAVRIANGLIVHQHSDCQHVADDVIALAEEVRQLRQEVAQLRAALGKAHRVIGMQLRRVSPTCKCDICALAHEVLADVDGRAVLEEWQKLRDVRTAARRYMKWHIADDGFRLEAALAACRKGAVEGKGDE